MTPKIPVTGPSASIPGSNLGEGAPLNWRDSLLWSGYVRPWLITAGILVLAKIILTVGFPQAFADSDQEALLRWPALAVFVALGLAGAALAGRTGFAPIAVGIRLPKTLGIALIVGACFGALMVLLDKTTHFTEAIAANHGVKQQYTGFLPMFLVFAMAAPAIVEVVYRLVLMPVCLWFTSRVILRGRGQEPMFWVLAVALSALEPFTQTPDLRILPVGVRIADTALQYALNLTQAVFFRKYGFVASILVRSGFYLVWHVLYVH